MLGGAAPPARVFPGDFAIKESNANRPGSNRASIGIAIGAFGLAGIIGLVGYGLVYCGMEPMERLESSGITDGVVALIALLGLPVPLLVISYGAAIFRLFKVRIGGWSGIVLKCAGCLVLTMVYGYVLMVPVGLAVMHNHGNCAW